MGEHAVAAIATLVIPYLPVMRLMGFVPLPLWLLASLVGLTLVYVAAAEVAKKLFFRKFTD